ncbi:hypothetical protein DL96DRAFT_299768 [Flagelloscypha sp. PMI_526]|nr:hypothetical protein DL96DRAFT_299768 [Flagelloscypha sp. PMI_526]
MVVTICDLPYDILFTIISLDLFDPWLYGLRDVFSVSLVSRPLRAAALPVLFQSFDMLSLDPLSDDRLLKVTKQVQSISQSDSLSKYIKLSVDLRDSARIPSSPIPALFFDSLLVLLVKISSSLKRIHLVLPDTSLTQFQQLLSRSTLSLHNVTEDFAKQFMAADGLRIHHSFNGKKADSSSSDKIAFNFGKIVSVHPFERNYCGWSP